MGTGRRLEVAGHLTVTELFERYRGAEDATVKAHLQVIWLKAQGWRTGEVARSTGFKPDWVRRLVHRYNEHGPESLGDRRASNGREPLLSEPFGFRAPTYLRHHAGDSLRPGRGNPPDGLDPVQQTGWLRCFCSLSVMLRSFRSVTSWVAEG